jgi:hypothetical protein
MLDMKKLSVLTVLALSLLFFGGAPSYAALTPGASYTITIQKMNSDGTVTDYSSTTATADGNGKLEFSLASMPTNADCNFIVFIIKDNTGTVVRKGFAPAPPAGNTNSVGVNNLSTVQTIGILKAGEVIGTDDPIPIAYLLVLMRSSSATENDGTIFANLGKEAITGTTGFEGTLLANGVTAAQLATFKSNLIYNATAGKKTIADLTASFKTAVDSGNDTTANQEMQKAGGFMADVFMDAAEAAGIDFSLILAAHDAAGVVAQSTAMVTLMSGLTSTVSHSMNQSMSSFFMRIASVKVKSEYSRALNTLNASGAQVDNFNNAVTTLMNANAAVDSTYSDYFSDPDAYVTAHGTSHTAVQNAISAAFNASFSTFQTNIQSTNAEITTMTNNVVAAFQSKDPSFNASYLPYHFGKYYDFTGTEKNWPIPQAVMVNWLASIIQAGGDLAYTRDTLTIPTNMQQWMGTCSNPSFYDKTSCEAAPATWTTARRTYSTPSSSFNAYQGIMEDIWIIENSRYAIYQSGQPTKEQEKQARITFKERMEATGGRISGTTNGSTAISAAQKDAIIKLLMQPSMD